MYHRRPVFFRADPTYSACSLRPMTNGKTGYDSMQSCQTSTACLGNAYTYVCGAEGQPPQLVFDTGGTIDARRGQVLRLFRLEKPAHHRRWRRRR